MMISSYMLVAFAGGVGAQQNNPVVNAPPESAPAAEGLPAVEAKPLTNERIVSMARSGISNGAIISLIMQFPSELDASPEALEGLRAAGVSDSVLNEIKFRAPARPPCQSTGQASAEPERSKIPATDNIVPMAADALNYAAVPEEYPASEAWGLGIVYPGAALRYQTSGNTAWEVKAQAGSGVVVAGPRFYYYLGSGSKLSLFCGAEGDYIRFKGEVSKGYGFAGGAFLGGEIFFAEKLSLSMDFGPMFMKLNDSEYSESVSGTDYIINMGVYWYFK